MDPIDAKSMGGLNHLVFRETVVDQDIGERA
jgi:hypothetical protein